MASPSRWLTGLALQLALPLVFVELCSRVGAAPPSIPASLARLSFLGAAIVLGCLGRPTPVGPGRWRLPWASIMLLAGLVVAAVLYALSASALAAWWLTLTIWVVAHWLLRLSVERAGEERHTPSARSASLRFVLAALLAGLVGASMVALEQLEGGFGEEEFFSALSAVVLATAWLLTLPALRSLSRRIEPLPGGAVLPLHRGWLGAGVAVLALGGGFITLRAYQASFFPAPPPFEGISAPQPVRCEQLPPPTTTYDGPAVYTRLLALVEAHPLKGAPEYAMLALGTGQETWAAQFREQLLAEAVAERFSGPANSVKYGQYEAAQRAYYFDRVSAAFPALFSADDRAALRVWFAAINRRALTVEWVDWLYALAFDERPFGPYVNQEAGAGLLAVLEATGLADPELSARNRAFLAQAERGWAARWRNSDDTYYYQSEWILSAFYQSLLADDAPGEQVRRSFEWLRLQATPDGRPVDYNFPYAVSADTIFYLGATLLDDPRLLWASGLAATSRARVFPYAAAMPGADGGLSLTAAPPSEGSCLLYGDTGTPTRPGPLGPDKLVFRTGWAPDATYLLLNLRFTGWHRYKATNTVSLLYSGGDLVADQLEGRTFSWLPRGRSAFRDKRIPRENLSGLLVARSGMSAVRHTLAAIDGPWAQDPPPFARVERFATGTPCDTSVTTIDAWRGWSHRRSISFCAGEPTVIADEALGRPGGAAALAWNLAAPAVPGDGRVRLSDNAELALVPLDAATLAGDPSTLGEGGYTRLLISNSGPRLRALAVLLTGPWVGAELTLDESSASPTLRITGAAGSVELQPFAK
jgi:hypothetical protein